METKRKYPRTYHLPWSLGITSDDKVLPNCDYFIGKRVIVTEKMDGENSTLYRDYFHARSLDSSHHPSQSWLKRFHSSIKSQIPDGWRICGENMYARHSIEYNDLLSYFYGFSVWNEDFCLSWEDTKSVFEMLGIVPVPCLAIETFSMNYPTTKDGWVSRI